MIIYKTTNLINGKFYVGLDTKNDPNYLGSGLLLKKAIQRYGREQFRKEILEECKTVEELRDREIFWINKLSAQNPNVGYNVADGGLGGDTFTNNPNKSQIRKKLRKNHSAETKEKISKNNWNSKTKGEGHFKTGTKWTSEQREKMIRFFEETGGPFKGKTHSLESKEINRKAHLGTVMSNESKQKIGFANRGTIHKIIECPYCGKAGGKPAMERWHFKNCKKYKDE